MELCPGSLTFLPASCVPVARSLRDHRISDESSLQRCCESVDRTAASSYEIPQNATVCSIFSGNRGLPAVSTRPWSGKRGDQSGSEQSRRGRALTRTHFLNSWRGATERGDPVPPTLDAPARMCYNLPMAAYSAVGPSPYLPAPLSHKCLIDVSQLSRKCLMNVSQVTREFSTPSYEITANDNE